MNRKKVFLAAQSVLCVILAVTLIMAALGIYREGLAQKAADPLNWIYSREKAAAALRPLLPLLVLYLAMTAIGLAMGIRDEDGEKPLKDTECLRDLTVSRTAAASDEMKSEQARQKKLLYAGRAVFVLSMIPILLYTTNGDHFPNGGPGVGVPRTNRAYIPLDCRRSSCADDLFHAAGKEHAAGDRGGEGAD